MARTMLIGEPLDNGLEQHLIPALTEYVIGKPGTIYMEEDILHNGQAIRRRVWRIDAGEESLIWDAISNI